MPAGFIPIPRRMNFGRPQITRLGPWPRGISLRFDPELIGPQALPYASNVDVLASGELRQRPPIRRADCSAATGTDATLLGLQNRWYAEATYIMAASVAATGTTSGTSVQLMGIFRSANSGYVSFINLTNAIAGSNQLVYKTNILSSNVVVYQGKAWGIVQHGSIVGTPGQVWSIDLTNLTAGPTFASTGPTASGTGFPGNIAIIKDRMYAWNYLIQQFGTPDYTSANNSTIWFSKTGNPAVFTGDPDAGSFALSSTDTPANFNYPVSIVSVRNSVYIFTRASTWLLSLPASGIPTNGTLSLLSEQVGALEPTCTAVYDNKVFVAGVNGIYEILNGTFTDIGYLLGPRIRNIFGYGNLSTVAISVAEGRLWVTVNPTFSTTDLSALYDPPVDSAFIFNLKTRAWSSYKLGPPAGYFGNPPPTWRNYVFSCYKVLPINNVLTSSGGVSVTTLQGGNTAQSWVTDGALLCDITSGAIYVFKDTEPTSDPFGTSQPEYLRMPWADTWDVFSSGVPTVQQPIPMTVWTQDIEGGSTETASWKRYYAIALNLYAPKWIKDAIAATASLTFTDHNGDTITDATLNFNTVQGQNYYSLKEYTSLRARHIQYRLTINPGTTGPFSLLNMDVLAKVKQQEQGATVGG